MPRQAKRPYAGGYINDAGYLIWTIGGKRVRAHRVIMEYHLGRKLEPWEDVHHRDEVKLNNHVSNLEVVANNEHRRTHHSPNLNGVDPSMKRCCECKRVKPREGGFSRWGVKPGARKGANKDTHQNKCKECASAEKRKLRAQKHGVH